MSDMKTPTKLTIEITAEEYKYTLTDEKEKVVWQSRYIMKSSGRSIGDGRNVEVTKCPALDDFEELVETIDDLSFGPFGVAQALYRIREF